MEYIDRVREAFDQGRICRESFQNLSAWLTGEEYRSFREELQHLIDHERWEELDDRFYKIIEFGTGGRRGSRGAGTNRINSRTIAESAQGLASYIFDHGDAGRGVVVTFDTRHGSREYAQTVCEVLAGNGIPTFAYESPRSTPQLSFSIRHLGAQAGCMISASHNPPSDNGIKVSWQDGGQVIPPHDKGIIARVTQVKEIRRMDFDDARAKGLVRAVGEDLDEAYMQALESLSLSRKRQAKVAFSPLHGVGATNVVKLLERLGFNIVTVLEQMKADPDFSTVKDRLPNPELPAAMERVTQIAAKTGADIALASDPDADRIGAMIPCPPWAAPGGWLFLNGNQIGALILDHVVRRMRDSNQIPPHPVVIKTIVTTNLLNAICKSAGIEVIDNLLVGFKYIAETTAALPAEKTLVFQTEESHGYNRGTFVRDKDAAPAALHLAELASELKSGNRSIFEHLNDLYRRHGLFVEHTRSVYYHGKSGQETMNRIMEVLRNHPPVMIGDRLVHHVIDRTSNTVKTPDGTLTGRIDQHTGNVMQFCFDAGGWNRLTARPSGTEPKIKFYAQLWKTLPALITDREIKAEQDGLIREANILIDDIASPEDIS